MTGRPLEAYLIRPLTIAPFGATKSAVVGPATVTECRVVATLPPLAVGLSPRSRYDVVWSTEYVPGTSPWAV